MDSVLLTEALISLEFAVLTMFKPSVRDLQKAKTAHSNLGTVFCPRRSNSLSPLVSGADTLLKVCWLLAGWHGNQPEKSHSLKCVCVSRLCVCASEHWWVKVSAEGSKRLCVLLLQLRRVESELAGMRSGAPCGFY